MASIINATTTNGVVASGDNSGALQLATNNGTTAVTINTSQGVSVLNCLAVGNATPSTSGAGITFPATQSASTDANTLDDYEEGTWTPSLPTATVTGSTIISGNYTKIGRLVYARFTMQNFSYTGGSGAVQVAGLPFANGTGSNDSTRVWSASLAWYYYVTGNANGQVCAYLSSNASTLTLYQMNNNGGTWSAVNYASSSGSGYYLDGNIVYQVS